MAKQYAFNGIVVNSNAMTKENADLINSAGFETGVWVVNSPEDFMAFKKMGVERFYTDCPRKLLELIDSDPEFKK
jgi:glycerophosphoryl diester phosphodiesterase